MRRFLIVIEKAGKNYSSYCPDLPGCVATGKTRAATEKNIEAVVDIEEEEDTPFRKVCRSRWAALIKKVYEVDPLKCPKCGGQMRIIAFIEKKEQADIIEKILRHCGLWIEPEERAPPDDRLVLVQESQHIPIDEFLANF